MSRILTVLTVMTLVLLAVVVSAKDVEEKKIFDGITSVDIQTVSGNCFITQSSDDKVEVSVKYSVYPADAFSPEMRRQGNTLKVEERWYGSSSGSVNWTISVPSDIEIEFETASGELDINDLVLDLEASTASGEISAAKVSGEFELSTASGDITVEDAEGEFELSCASGEIQLREIKGVFQLKTASGDIEIENGEGRFELRCASGDIEAGELSIGEASSFSTASGEVEVSLKKASTYDLELKAASGNVTLDLNGNAVTGVVVSEYRKDRGNLNSPLKPVNEEEFQRNGYTYNRVTHSAGDETPVFSLSTVSGRITIIK